MTRLRVRVRNSQYDQRHRYGYQLNEFNVYEGAVIPNPKWGKPDSFCLTTSDPQFPFRVIDKESIVDGWQLPSLVSAPKSPVSSKIVEGSNGRKYVLTKSGNRWSCNCTGFSYRKTCTHIKQNGISNAN